MAFKCSIVLSVSLLAVSVPAAWGHAYPTVSIPADGAMLREAPHEIRIQFTEGIEIEFCQIVVKNSNGQRVNQGSLRRVADDTLAVDLKPARLGTYTIEWQVLSVDTHVTEGVLRFSVVAVGK